MNLQVDPKPYTLKGKPNIEPYSTLKRNLKTLVTKSHDPPSMVYLSPAGLEVFAIFGEHSRELIGPEPPGILEFWV